MSKADQTRAHILHQAATLFNQRGYAGASMSELMQATGLKKGGIYNHFASKDELAIAAFDFAARQMSQRYRQVLKQPGAISRLQAMVQVFAADAPIAGGCPLMNTAIDSDDAHPALRQRAQVAMGRWRSLIASIVERGLQSGELRAGTAPETVATLMISTLEGALMLTQLYGDRAHLERAKAHLNGYIEGLKAAVSCSVT